MTADDRAREEIAVCRAVIFPRWSNRWVSCGAVLVDGRCAQYGGMHDRANDRARALTAEHEEENRDA